MLKRLFSEAVRCNSRTANASEDNIIKSIKAWLVRCKSRNEKNKIG